MATTTHEGRGEGTRAVKVWDVAVRLFHWLLVLLIAAAWSTGQAKGNWMVWHMYAGFSILTLVLFRIAWGVVGSTHARFSSFIYGPSKVITYVFRSPRVRSVAYLGHNALGGWMIVALLIGLLTQSVTGLFANDDIVSEGPLVKWISKHLSDRMTELHQLGFNVLLLLVVLHVGVILFYWLVRKDNLILPMFTGVKHVPARHADRAQLTPRMTDRRASFRAGRDRRRPTRPAEVQMTSMWVAALLLAAAAVLVYLVTTITPG